MQRKYYKYDTERETFEFTHPGENGLRTPKTALCDINPLRGKWLQNAKISGSRLQNLLQILSASNLLFHFPFLPLPYLSLLLFVLLQHSNAVAKHCAVAPHLLMPKAQSSEAFGAWPERPTCTVVVFWAGTGLAPQSQCQAKHLNAATGQKGAKINMVMVKRKMEKKVRCR